MDNTGAGVNIKYPPCPPAAPGSACAPPPSGTAHPLHRRREENKPLGSQKGRVSRLDTQTPKQKRETHVGRVNVKTGTVDDVSGTFFLFYLFFSNNPKEKKKGKKTNKTKHKTVDTFVWS